MANCRVPGTKYTGKALISQSCSLTSPRSSPRIRAPSLEEVIEAGGRNTAEHSAHTACASGHVPSFLGHVRNSQVTSSSARPRPNLVTSTTVPGHDHQVLRHILKC
eukprot:144201-Rhodomonas_salina.2